jgi:uncharacterized protein (TIGR02646 family)
VARRAADPSAEFWWPKQVNQRLLPELLAMTQAHCAYCDGWPMDATGQPTIDHFRPKSRYPHLAFAWGNLFPSCDRCQGSNGKGDEWNEALLKPDDLDYSFERYFVYDMVSGWLEPNPAASAPDYERALVTIDLLGLNEGGRPALRKRVLRDYAAFEERPYRFLFEPG